MILSFCFFITFLFLGHTAVVFYEDFLLKSLAKLIDWCVKYLHFMMAEGNMGLDRDVLPCNPSCHVVNPSFPPTPLGQNFIFLFILSNWPTSGLFMNVLLRILNNFHEGYSFTFTILL